MEERCYYLGFSSFSGIGPHKFSLLFDYFHSGKNAWLATKSELLDAKLGEKTTEKLEAFRKTFDLEKYAESLEKKQIQFVTLTDTEYPERLKQIPNAPFLLYMKGSLSCLSEVEGVIRNDTSTLLSEKISDGFEKKVIAVVGTRRITSYGRAVTELFTESLVQAGCVIVSGLALGVDAVAHQATIDTKGKTIAVLGCGVDCCFPKENLGIYQQILESGGVIVSEFPLSAPPTIGSFPARNRIVAGLSDAVLVTEGAEDSGALITADFALQYERKAFAIPGAITSSLSKGPYKLLKNGGVLVTSTEELLEKLGLKGDQRGRGDKRKVVKGDTKDEQKIIELLAQESLRIDDLIKRIGIASSELSAVLSMMEIKGFIVLQNGYYSL
ncbi:DNA-processing protein DprA [soil metagenome]